MSSTDPGLGGVTSSGGTVAFTNNHQVKKNIRRVQSPHLWESTTSGENQRSLHE